MKGILTIERRTRDGVLIKRYPPQPMHSFVKGFIQALYVHMAGIQDGAPYSMTDVGGTPRNIDSRSYGASQKYQGNLIMTAPCGGAIYVGAGLEGSDRVGQNAVLGQTFGILIGTNNTAVTPTDIAMNTIVPQGVGAGQMEYGGMQLRNYVVSAPSASFDLRRYFNNNSGGGITIQEVGLATVMGQYSNYGNTWAFLIARDVVSPGVLVNDTEILSVTYTISITV